MINHLNTARRAMKTSQYTFIFLLLTLNMAIAGNPDSLRNPQERRLKNIRQLTFGGTNAEAYFSFDDRKLIFQSTRQPFECDQIFTMNVDGSEQKLVSTGKGLTTCGFFFPDGKHILYASTHAFDDKCIPRPDKSKGYVWGVWSSFEIYKANADGSHPTVLTSSPGYDAEATISPSGKKIVFTSSREGDLDLYTMDLDGKNIRRVTKELGYDGGANFSWDDKSIVYRGYHPKDSAEVREYKSLLAEQLVKPSKMEIFVCDADGQNNQQLTSNGAANFAPIFHPDNKRIIFASNMKLPRGRSFELYIMNRDGSGLEQVTFGDNFNSFPMFTRDGKKLVFVSDRNAKDRYEFNVFLADWVD